MLLLLLEQIALAFFGIVREVGNVLVRLVAHLDLSKFLWAVDVLVGTARTENDMHIEVEAVLHAARKMPMVVTGGGFCKP